MGVIFKKRLNLVCEGEADPGAGGGAGGGGSSWAESLPESVRSWDEVKNSESPEKFWEQVSNMRTFLGQSIRIPSEDAGKEAIAEFHNKLVTKVPALMPRPNPDDPESVKTVYKALGHPETPEGYKVPEFTPPQGVQIDTAPIESFRKVAHEAGLTTKQFESIVSSMTAESVARAAEQQQKADNGIAQLTREWGHAFDQNFKQAISIAERTDAPPALIQALRESRIDAASVKWLHKLADSFRGEPNAGRDKNHMGIITPGEATERISEMMNNKEHAYWVASHPDHKAAVKRMLDLRALADPTAQTDPNALRHGGGVH